MEGELMVQLRDAADIGQKSDAGAATCSDVDDHAWSQCSIGSDQELDVQFNHPTTNGHVSPDRGHLRYLFVFASTTATVRANKCKQQNERPK